MMVIDEGGIPPTPPFSKGGVLNAEPFLARQPVPPFEKGGLGGIQYDASQLIVSMLAAPPGGVGKIRALIRDLAVDGRLAPEGSKGKNWNWSVVGAEVTSMDSGWSPECLDFPVSSEQAWGVLKTTAVQPLKYLQNENKQLPDHLYHRPELEVKAGDILFTRAGPMNRVGISCLVDSTRARLMLSDKIIRFRPNPARLSGKFLALCLNAGITARYLERAKSGMAASQVNISQAKLKQAPIPVPSLSEQHRIVAKVDELMALCDRLEARQQDAEAAHARLVQALLDSLTQAGDAQEFQANWERLAGEFEAVLTTEASVDALKQTLVHLATSGRLVQPELTDEPAQRHLSRCMAAKQAKANEGRRQKDLALDELPLPPFVAPAGWVWTHLDAVLMISGGVTLGRKLGGKKTISRPYLRVANVQRGHLDLTQMKEVDIPEDELEKYALRSHDLLITEGGDWDKVGRTAIWRDEVPECLHQNHIFRARACDESFDVQWAELYLNSAPARDYFAGSSKQTTNLASINMRQLRSCRFPMPPLAEQQRILAKVGELFSICDRLKSRIIATREKQAQLARVLVEKAVAG